MLFFPALGLVLLLIAFQIFDNSCFFGFFPFPELIGETIKIKCFSSVKSEDSGQATWNAQQSTG